VDLVNGPNRTPKPTANACRKLAKVFWFFFFKKEQENKRLLFEKRSKNFLLLGLVVLG
jgi:hypothetical protein